MLSRPYAKFRQGGDYSPLDLHFVGYSLNAAGTMWVKIPFAAQPSGLGLENWFLLATYQSSTCPSCEGHVPCALRDAAVGFQILRIASFFFTCYLRQAFKNFLFSCVWGPQESLNKLYLCCSVVLPGDISSETSLAFLQFFESCPSAAALPDLPTSKSWENTLIFSREERGNIKTPIVRIHGSNVFAAEYSWSRNPK